MADRQPIKENLMKCIIFADDRQGREQFQDQLMMNLSYCDEFLVIAGEDAMEALLVKAGEISEIKIRFFDGEGQPWNVFDRICGDLPEDEVIVVLETQAAGYPFTGTGYKRSMLEAIKRSGDGMDSVLMVKQEEKEISLHIFVSTAGRLTRSKKPFQDIFSPLFVPYDVHRLSQGKREEARQPQMIKLKPAFKDYLWGGTKLREQFGKQSDLSILAESWELSAHPDGRSIVVSTEAEELYFDEWIEKQGWDVLGWKCRYLSDFPILIKFIDAKNPLSIQVHPDDEYALTKEDEYGKNEMWYILEAEEGAGIYCGFNRETSREEVRKKIEDNTILEILNWVPAKKGDVFMIKAGTVHAIGAGIMICEIQQSSNCTYRLYDYDRKDKFGKKRELHIEKALDVLRFEKYADGQNRDPKESSEVNASKELVCCKYFRCEENLVDGERKLDLSLRSFRSLVCVEGSGRICLGEQKLDFVKGDSIFITCGEGEARVTGHCELVMTEV